MQVFGSNELMEDVHKRELCIGCGACVDLCPYFKNFKGKTSQLFPCNLEQGRCYAYCPKAEVDLNELTLKTRGNAYDGSPLASYRKVLAARAGEKVQLDNVQGGGTVTALLTFAMKTGLIDAAALTGRQALTPLARLVTDWKEIAGYATSKFMASPTLSALNTAVREGYQRIGVAGTPCQMIAVAQMRSNPLGKEEHNVPVTLTVGLFCNWSLDTRRLMDLLSEKLDTSGIGKMDIPPPPAKIMVLETDKGRVEVPLSDIKPLIPHTCYIIRSDTGAELVEQAHEEGFIETAVYPSQNLKHLSKAASDKKERSLRTLIRRGLINNQDDEHAAVRIPPEIVNKILNRIE
jgi:coenzyme F420 hydrogenase subunit beta